MVIDGNDLRGIDVGIMTKDGFPIGTMRSHVHDLKPNGKPVFSRDCPEYQVATPSGKTIWVLPNHFKSKFGGNDAGSQAKRRAQSEAVAAIYQRLRTAGEELIAVHEDVALPAPHGGAGPLGVVVGRGGCVTPCPNHLQDRMSSRLPSPGCNGFSRRHSFSIPTKP